MFAWERGWSSIIADNGQNVSQAWWRGIGTVRGGEKKKAILMEYNGSCKANLKKITTDHILCHVSRPWRSIERERQGQEDAIQNKCAHTGERMFFIL